MNSTRHLNRYSEYLLTQFDKELITSSETKVSVNPVVSEVATWYEKIRNAMDYREDDVILRAAIERILRRRLMLGGNGDSVAEPLVRELVWARYFPDASVPESLIYKISQTVDLYFSLEKIIKTKHKVNKQKLNDFILNILSAEIENILSPSKDKELLINFLFQIYQNKVNILDDDEETRDAQIFIAIRRTFGKQDLPLLKYHLFKQLFGNVTENTKDKIAENFLKGYKKIEYQLSYPLAGQIYTFIKKEMTPMYILRDVLKQNRGKNQELVENEEKFKLAIINECTSQYKKIHTKVQTAIIRGVIFILITKAIFALAVEGTFERFYYGRIHWNSIALNTLFPPVLMVLAGLLISTPNKENSDKLYYRIENILFHNEKIASKSLRRQSKKNNSTMYAFFMLLWFLALLLFIGMINYILSVLGFTIISRAIFIFFLAIVSFISYRIHMTAHMYTISDDKQSIVSVLFDFLFMPFIHLGRQLTENISKVNILLFIFDMFIETPFKVIFAFFEQWFLFLRTQREKLG
jgi:hypothetical protein